MVRNVLGFWNMMTIAVYAYTSTVSFENMALITNLPTEAVRA